jgi:hypothetical protein
MPHILQSFFQNLRFLYKNAYGLGEPYMGKLLERKDCDQYESSILGRFPEWAAVTLTQECEY